MRVTGGVKLGRAPFTDGRAPGSPTPLRHVAAQRRPFAERALRGFASSVFGEESVPNVYRSKTKDRLKRILVLVRTLQTADSESIDTLAQEFGVSRRTMFRDLALLREAGIGIQRNRRTKTYTVTRDVSPPRFGKSRTPRPGSQRVALAR